MIKREAKKQKKPKHSRGVDDDDDQMSDGEVALEAQLSTRTADGEEKTPEDIQDEMVEQLAEKRASTRVAALHKLIDQLQTSVQYDFVSNRFDTLTMYLLASVRKGDATEVVQATRALSLLAVTLGAEADKLASEATPVFNEYLKNTSKSPAGRAAVGEALGFVNFIGSANDHDTQQAMALLMEQLRYGNSLPEQVATAAWESYALLASTLPTHKLAGEVLDGSLPLLTKYLDHESIEVKTAAGQCIALLWENKQAVEAEQAGAQEDAELTMLPESAIPTEPTAAQAAPVDSDAQMTDVAEFSLSASTRSPAIVPKKRPHAKTMSSLALGASATSSSTQEKPNQEELISRFSALAKDSGRSHSKKDRATQKRNFREFLRTVEDGDVPEESLKIEKSRHEFSGWSHILQLDAIRDVIGKGLNTHFVHNETLKEIFDLYIEVGEGVDDPSRKAASRAQSKLKARENFESRQKQRKKKNAFQAGEEA